MYTNGPDHHSTKLAAFKWGASGRICDRAALGLLRACSDSLCKGFLREDAVSASWRVERWASHVKVRNPLSLACLGCLKACCCGVTDEGSIFRLSSHSHSYE